MAAMARIVPGFHNVSWYPDTVPEIVMCIAVVIVGSRFFRGCDAAIDLRGSVLSTVISTNKFLRTEPETIVFKCWFSVGALEAFSIQQTRKLFSDPNGEFQPLSLTPRSQLDDPNPLNLYAVDRTSITGSLKEGVTYTISRANCDDAGDYRCEFFYQTFKNAQFINKVTVESRRLGIRANKLECVSDRQYVDFAAIFSRPVFLKIHCYVHSTLRLNWVWETKGKFDKNWSLVAPYTITNNVPSMADVCRRAWRSDMIYSILPSDKNRQFRVYVTFQGGRSTKSKLELLDAGDGFAPDFSGDMNFQAAITITGWTLMSVVISITIFILYSNSTSPGRSVFATLRGCVQRIRIRMRAVSPLGLARRLRRRAPQAIVAGQQQPEQQQVPGAGPDPASAAEQGSQSIVDVAGQQEQTGTSADISDRFGAEDMTASYEFPGRLLNDESGGESNTRFDRDVQGTDIPPTPQPQTPTS